MGFIPMQKSEEVINRKALQRMESRRVRKVRRVYPEFFPSSPGIPILFFSMEAGLHANSEGVLIAVWLTGTVRLEQAIAKRKSKKWMSRMIPKADVIWRRFRPGNWPLCASLSQNSGKLEAQNSWSLFARTPDATEIWSKISWYFYLLAVALTRMITHASRSDVKRRHDILLRPIITVSPTSEDPWTTSKHKHYL